MYVAKAKGRKGKAAFRTKPNQSSQNYHVKIEYLFITPFTDP